MSDPIDDILDNIFQELLDDLGLGSWKTDHLGVVKAKLAITDSIQGQTGHLADSATPKALSSKADNLSDIRTVTVPFIPGFDSDVNPPSWFAEKVTKFGPNMPDIKDFKLHEIQGTRLVYFEDSDEWVDLGHNGIYQRVEQDADSPETSTDTASLPLLDTIRRQLLEAVGNDEDPGRTKGPGMPSLQRDQMRREFREAINRICRGGSNNE